MPAEGLTHHDTGAKYLQVRNLRFSQSGLDWSINYPARSLDPQLEFAPFNPKQYVAEQGRIHLQWPIFLGLLTRIPWKVMGFWGLYLVPFLTGLGTLWATYLLALRIGMPRQVAWLVVPLLGLATPISMYSLLFFEHTLASLLVTLSLLAALAGLPSRGSHKGEGQNEFERCHSSLRSESLSLLSTRFTAFSGALLAIAVYFRSELYVLAAVMGGTYLFLAWKRQMKRVAIAWLVAFVLALIPLWAFYAISEGTILPLHALWYFTSSEGSKASGATLGGLPPLRYIASAGWRVVPDFLFGPQNSPLSPVLPLWASAAGLAGVGLCGVAGLLRFRRFQTGRMTWRLGLLLTGLSLIVVATVPTLFSDQPYYNLHGFLLASPFITLALWPTGKTQGATLAPETWLRIVILLYVGLHVLIISAFSGLGTISRHEWGQRYLLPAYPALAVLSLFAAWRLWSACKDIVRERRLALACIAVWAALASAGVGFNFRGYVALREERTQVVAWMQLARTLPSGEPLVTDVWWLPLNLAADFYTRPIMLAEGDTRMADWAEKMKQRGVTGFGLMSDNPGVFTSRWHDMAKGVNAEGAPQQVSGMWLQYYKIGKPPNTP